MSIHHELEQSLERRVGADFRSKRYLLAVSGGKDSTLLLAVFAEILAASQLAVAHFNHGLRGEESEGDESQVREQAARLGLGFHSGRGTGQGRAEDTLRRERRAYLERTRLELGFDYIVTAHHADDQLETLLMRLLRGAGLDGLGGIAPLRGPWLRPLLHIPRERLQRESARRKLTHRYDRTNDSLEYLRNEMRHRAIPPLTEASRAFGGPEAVLERLGSTLEELRWAAEVIEEETARRLDTLGHRTELWTRLDAHRLFLLDPPWRARILRRVLVQLGAPTPERSVVERVLTALLSGKRGAEVPGGIRVTASCGQIYFQTREQLRRSELPAPLLVAQWGIFCPVTQLRIRAHSLPPGAEWRRWLPGDRWRGKKAKERLLSERVPKPERALLPVIAKAGSPELLWMPTGNSNLIASVTHLFPFSFSFTARGGD